MTSFILSGNHSSFWKWPEEIFSWLHRVYGKDRTRCQSSGIPTQQLEWEMSSPTELFSCYSDTNPLNNRDDKEPGEVLCGVKCCVIAGRDNGPRAGKYVNE